MASGAPPRPKKMVETFFFLQKRNDAPRSFANLDLEEFVVQQVFTNLDLERNNPPRSASHDCVRPSAALPQGASP